ncbi:hypothetical protein JXA59_02600 [Patescibacteria group bacterium]|nr:hypothetical protein [Patescibacteria group bacterium]
MNAKQWGFILLLVILIAAALMVWQSFGQTRVAVTDFNSCAATGRAVMESYPRQCAYGGKTFTENIGNALEKTDLIQVSNPTPNQTIKSPLAITGQAIGSWYFEASFPTKLFDANNNQLAEGIATAQGDWMTTNFVPFTATLNFSAQPANSAGTLILYKDNPSGLPANDDQLTIPVTF